MIDNSCKITHISDTHGYHDTLTLLGGDILIHSGDILDFEKKMPIEKIVDWIDRTPYDFKIIVLGNHDEELLNYKLPENIVLPEPHPLPVQLIEENINKINWKIESSNPNIFELDYKQMSILRTELIFEKLMEKTWSRSRLCQCINMENEIDIL